MRKLNLTDRAGQDLDAIYAYTEERYSQRQADQYEQLLSQSLKDIQHDPYRPESKDRTDIGSGLRSLHTRHSTSRSGTEVKNPRHVVIYYLPNEDQITVSRILHDSMDVQRHISEAEKNKVRASSKKIQFPPHLRENDRDKDR